MDISPCASYAPFRGKALSHRLGQIVLCACLVGLHASACAQDGDVPSSAEEEKNRGSFSVRILAPGDLRRLLARHLSLERYRGIPDLSRDELERLMSEAESESRDLLATQGYFSPKISIGLDEASAAPGSGKTPQVLFDVDPGLPTRVDRVDLQFTGEGIALPRAQAQLAEVRNQWRLPAGEPFTQDAWSNAKSNALQGLRSRRFAAARLVDSEAEIDPDANLARLSLRYDSGPAFRLGEIRIAGAERYDEGLARHLSRLRRGADYDQRDLVNAQRYLTDSGYYRGAFARIESGPGIDPQEAPVVIEVQEEKLKKQTIGIGASTDYGPRLSYEQIDNRSLLFGWRSVGKIEVNARQQNLSYGLLAPPDENLWRWLANASLQRETLNDYTTDSARVRAGRSKLEAGLERTLYAQYDGSRIIYGNQPESRAQALSLNHAWVYRHFDSLVFPRTGYGIALEIGGGSTLQPSTHGFVRAYGRYQGFLSLDGNLLANLRRALPTGRQLLAVALGDAETLSDEAAFIDQVSDVAARRNGELVLRLEGGAAVADASATLPAGLLFLTGGDASVRGYGYRSIGVADRYGKTEGGRYLLVGSLEYRRPWHYDGRPTDWDSLVFVDTGGVANHAGQISAKVGVGVGALWRSPVGPVQIAVAYGVQNRALRLHLNLGFNF